MPYIFKIGQRVKVNKLGHARHGQVGRILYHWPYVENEPVGEVVHFGFIAKGPNPTFDSAEFAQTEIEAAR